MSTEKHTPGPWRLGNTNSVVCDSDEGTWGDEDNRSHYGGALVAESIRTEANARLIAAAPELLEALQSLMQWWSASHCQTEDDDMPVDILNSAHAAIEKALGN